MYDIIETHHRTLITVQALDVERSNYSSNVVPSILEKFPRNTQVNINNRQGLQRMVSQQLVRSTESKGQDFREKHQAARQVNFRKSELVQTEYRQKMFRTSSTLFSRQGNKRALCLGNPPPPPRSTCTRYS